MMQMWGRLWKRLGREDGATMVEYSVMVVLIAAASIVIITTIGTDVRDLFESSMF